MVNGDGSSPLARGTGLRGLLAQLGHRFIPAGAGNSAGLFMKWREVTVHPRWRGEQSMLQSIRESGSGSSPLTRGTGLTAIAESLGCTVHPRWRGEQISAAAIFADKVRFIPAGAGNRMA